MHLECLKSFLWHFQKQPISYYAMPFLEPWATYSWMLFFSQRAKGRQRCVLYGPVTVHDVSWQSYSFLVLDLTFWIVLWCDVRFFQRKQNSMATVADFDRSGVCSFFTTHTLWLKASQSPSFWMRIAFWRNRRNSKILHRTSEENILIKSYSRCEVKAYQTDTGHACSWEQADSWLQ